MLGCCQYRFASDPEEGSKAKDHAAWALACLVCDRGQHDYEILETLLEADCLDGLLSVLPSNDQSVVHESLKAILVFVATRWNGKRRAIEALKADKGVILLRAFKLRPEAGLAYERLMTHKILREYLGEFSLPPRV